MVKPAQGCVTRHSVAIYDRGGFTRLGVLLNLSRVEYTRILSNLATAVVQISAKNCGPQLATITGLAAKRHEMVIFRGDERAWEGVIVDLRWSSSGVEIYCEGVKSYLDGTPLSKAWPPPVADHGSPMTDRVSSILNYELTTPFTMQTDAGAIVVPRWESLDPPANILPFLEVRPSTTLLTFSDTTAFQMSVGKHLDDLAESGLDYVEIGRKIVIWDSGKPLGKTRVLTNADFYGEPIVYTSGRDLAVMQHLFGNSDGLSETAEEDAPVVGHAGAPDDFYGVWSLSDASQSEDSDNVSEATLQSQAKRRLRGRKPAPTQIVLPDGVGIRLNSSLSLNELVPGVTVPIRATMNLRPVYQDQRLHSLKVTETGDGETISGSFSPIGEVVA